jgi:hypothetical protein
MSKHSGIKRSLDSFTVAGAAPGLAANSGGTGFPVSLKPSGDAEHLKQARRLEPWGWSVNQHKG